MLAALLILPWSAGALPAPGGATRPAQAAPGPWQFLSQAWGVLVSLFLAPGGVLEEAEAGQGLAVDVLGREDGLGLRHQGLDLPGLAHGEPLGPAKAGGSSRSSW